MTGPVCFGCDAAIDCERPRLCESCQRAVEIAAQHGMSCDCAACQVWATVYARCDDSELLLADVTVPAPQSA